MSETPKKQSNFIPPERPKINTGEGRQDMTQHATMVDRDLQHLFLYVDGLPQFATTGTAASASTPIKIGLTYIDTVANKVYISCGTSSSADWRILN
jgi:hypothetical protein